MANTEIHNVSIKGIAACVPKHIEHNSNNPLFTMEELDRVCETTGVYRRRTAVEGVTTSDFCVAATEKLLIDLNWDKSDIEVLVFVTQTPDYRNPATSCLIQDRLGLKTTCMALDVSLGCSGYVYGLSIISSIMSAGKLKKGLLLVGDTANQTSSPLDKSRALLFGDAGAATALEYDENAETMKFDFGTDGSGYQAIYTPHSGFRNRVKPESFEMVDYGGGIVRAKVHSWLDGLEVFSFGISRAPKTVKSLWNYFGLTEAKFDYFLFHQANKQMNEKIRNKLEIPVEKVPYNLADFGNCSSASIPLLMVTNLTNELQSNSLNLCFCGFGVGLSWGTVAVVTDKIVVSELVEI
jgi:3-oxoacyl-[acyl-carrier-protein] synthase-3